MGSTNRQCIRVLESDNFPNVSAGNSNKGVCLSSTNTVQTTQPGGMANVPQLTDAVLLTVSPVTRRILRMVFVLAAARALGPGKFGVYALLITLVEFLAMTSGTGFQDFLTRESAKDESCGWGLGSQLTVLRLAYIVPLCLAGVVLLLLLNYPRAVLVSGAYLFVTLVPRAVSEAVQGVLRGLRAYQLFFAIDIALGLTLLAGAGALLLKSGGLAYVIATELISATVAALVALAFTVYRRPSFSPWLKWSSLVRNTAAFNIYPIIGSLYNRVDVVILSKLSGNYATGIYTSAYRVMELFQLIPYGVLYSLLPNLARYGLKGNERQRLERAMALLLSSAFAVVLATQVFASPAVRIFLGAAYSESAAAIKILIWALIPMCINYSLNIALLAEGREKVFLATSSVCFVFNLLANLIFIPRFSWPGAAAVTIATEILLFGQNVYWVHRATGVVPFPRGAWRVALAFLVLWSVSFVGAGSNLSLWIGAGCLTLFVMYLHRAGTLVDFRSVWRPGWNATT